jgi:zinc transporter 1/2/3
LLKLNNARTIIKCTLIYTGMVPFGLVLGSILSLILSGESAILTTAILNGIASGTFIYIAIVDILLEQFNDAHYKFYKYMFTFFGFFVITGLFLMFDEGHE